MSRILHPLFALLASSARQDLARQDLARQDLARQDLARQVAYLREENQILRSKLPKQVAVTEKERNRLVRAGRKLGIKLKELISIVTYGSFLRWVRQTGPVPDAKKGSKRKPGRPRKADDVRELILKLARENDWGYTRILGQLRRLGIKISRQTVKNILVENGLEPGPERCKRTWDEFLWSHAQTLWQCDFATKRMWTLRRVDVVITWENPATTVFIEMKYGSPLSSKTANNNGSAGFPADQLVRNARIGLYENGWFEEDRLFHTPPRDFVLILMTPTMGHPLVHAYRDPDRLKAAIPHGERLKQLPLAPFIGELSYENVTEILQLQRRWFSRPEQKLIDGLHEYIGFKLIQLRELNGGGR